MNRFTPMNHPYAPMVEQARRETLIGFGVNPDAWYPTKEDYEVARNFDVTGALKRYHALRAAKSKQEDVDDSLTK